MENHPVNFTRLALNDLHDIWLYLAENSSIEKADSVIDEIKDFCLDYLSMFPEMGRMREDLQIGLRFFPHPHNDYLVFYSIDGGEVNIHHVFHGSREYSELF
jgi:plasmid stabilization system protein ParE